MFSGLTASLSVFAEFAANVNVSSGLWLNTISYGDSSNVVVI